MRATDGGLQAARRRVSLGISASGIANRGRPVRPGARGGGPSPIGTRRARSRLIAGHGRARPGESGRWQEPEWFRGGGVPVDRGRVCIARLCEPGSSSGG